MRFTTFCRGLLNLASRIHRCLLNRMSLGQTTTPATPCPTLHVSGCFNTTAICKKGCEMEPPAYSPYPRKLESLAICCFNCKGSTFNTLSIGPAGVELTTDPRNSPMFNQLSQRCGVIYFHSIEFSNLIH